MIVPFHYRMDAYKVDMAYMGPCRRGKFLHRAKSFTKVITDTDHVLQTISRPTQINTMYKIILYMYKVC